MQLQAAQDGILKLSRSIANESGQMEKMEGVHQLPAFLCCQSNVHFLLHFLKRQSAKRKTQGGSLQM